MRSACTGGCGTRGFGVGSFLLHNFLALERQADEALSVRECCRGCDKHLCMLVVM